MEEMHNLANVEFVDKRRIINILTIVQGDNFDMIEHGVNTRFNDGKKINLLKPRNETVRKSCLYMRTSLWNNLNLELRDSDLKVFKKNVKRVI